jgi:hypothetical protein
VSISAKNTASKNGVIKVWAALIPARITIIAADEIRNFVPIPLDGSFDTKGTVKKRQPKQINTNFWQKGQEQNGA